VQRITDLKLVTPPQALVADKGDVWSAGVVILEMTSGRYPFPASTEDGIIEAILTVLGPITMEQVRDIGVDPLLYPELLAGSTFNVRRWSDIQVFPKTPSVELLALLNQCLEYSPRRRADAATILEHDFFKSEEGKNIQEL
jgi:serine/threonine protein kinase